MRRLLRTDTVVRSMSRAISSGHFRPNLLARYRAPPQGLSEHLRLVDIPARCHERVVKVTSMPRIPTYLRPGNTELSTRHVETRRVEITNHDTAPGHSVRRGGGRWDQRAIKAQSGCVTAIRARPRFYQTPSASCVNLSLDLEPRQKKEQHVKEFEKIEHERREVAE